MKTFAKFDWLVETEGQETSVPRPKRQRPVPPIKAETPSAMRKKQRVGTSSHPIPIDVEDDSAQDDVVVRGWEPTLLQIL